MEIAEAKTIQNSGEKQRCDAKKCFQTISYPHEDQELLQY